MKSKKWVYLIIIFIVALLVISFLNTRDKKNKPEIKYIDDIKIISSNGDYALVEGQEPNYSIFTVYKSLGHGNYQKTFSFPIGSNVESRLICWTYDKIYFFGFTIASFDLETGAMIDEGNRNILTGSSTGYIDAALGIYDENIYYEYTATGEEYHRGYGKVSLDLKNVKFIEKDDVPKFLLR